MIVLSYRIPSEHPNSCQTPSDKTTHTIFSSDRNEENVVNTNADSIIVMHCLVLGWNGSLGEEQRGLRGDFTLMFSEWRRMLSS